MAPAEPDDDPRVPVVCPECETTSRVPLADLAETIDRHNDQLHDGEAIAEVDPDVADHIADLIATELGLLDAESE
ncbi:hypothetical protein [Halopiger thermotolerans]